MAYRFTPDDVGFLTSGAGRAALAALVPGGDRLADVAAARRLVGPEHAAALLETVLLRERARGRFPDGWLWTADALEQATALPVARHRAARLAAVAGDRVVADVTCSVGVETAVLSGVLDRVVGADLDPVRLAMARANVPEGAAGARGRAGPSGAPRGGVGGGPGAADGVGATGTPSGGDDAAVGCPGPGS